MTNEYDTVDRLAQIIRTFLAQSHNVSAAAIADGIVDSGFLWEIEQAAFNRGYDAGYENAEYGWR